MHELMALEPLALPALPAKGHELHWMQGSCASAGWSSDLAFCPRHGAASASPASAATTWNTGDVFVAVANGSYNVYDNAGAFKQTITSPLSGTTTGCSFNAAGDKLYTTNWSNNKAVVYDNADPHPILQTISTSSGRNES